MMIARFVCLSTAVLFCILSSSALAAELRGYWTLDNLTTGIQNQGTDGATSNMSYVSAPGITAGIIGSAVQIASPNNMLQATAAGNAADDLAGYPYTLSIWTNRTAADGGVDNVLAIGMSDISEAGTHYGLGVNVDSGRGMVLTRNTTFDPHTGGPNLNDGQWHHLLGVFNSNTSIQLYVDGVLVTTDMAAQTFSSGVDGMFIGGAVRSNTQNILGYRGRVDDAGLFDGALAASGAALINGLGRIGGWGLNYLDEAQALLESPLGTDALIAGYNWRRVTGLLGAPGTFGGSLAGYDGFIVTGIGGEGLQMVEIIPIPEPGTFALALCGVLMLRHRRRRAHCHSA